MPTNILTQKIVTLNSLTQYNDKLQNNISAIWDKINDIETEINEGLRVSVNITNETLTFMSGTTATIVDNKLIL